MNGVILTDVNADTPENQLNIYNVRAVDLRLTFRSKSKFFRIASNKIIQGIGSRAQPFQDRYLRESVIVTVYTRNIGS